jgi:hypothetical protein
MNFLGFIAVALSIWGFALTSDRLRPCPVIVRLVCCGAFVLLSVPALLFAVYYLHILPERAWFYTLRSWRGSEFLVIFLGCATGAAASLLPRLLLGLPLFAFLALGVLPYIKPVIAPIPDKAFREHWEGAICLQSTLSTCGPASVCTVLRRLGASASEQAAARAAFSYEGGTEAWYLARYVRGKGFVPRFEFRDTFSPEVGLPAVVGVRVGGCGHFIAVLDLSGDQITFADPMIGEQRLSLSAFRRRYDFTGFHMTVTAGGRRLLAGNGP